MAYRLFKSEPEAHSRGDPAAERRDDRDGARNRQAAGDMKKTRLGDRAFFHRSVGAGGPCAGKLLALVPVVAKGGDVVLIDDGNGGLPR